MTAATIAVDGPVASGKSVVGAAVAEALGYTYFDTGAVYRAATWACLEQGVLVEDWDAVAEVARSCRIEARRAEPGERDGRQYTVLVDGRDVTWEMRSPEVERAVSVVSAYPEVRAALLEQQRSVARRGQAVIVGRDVGTVVWPQAELKVFLTADVEVRARRRFEELAARGQAPDFQALLSDLQRRDRIDTARKVAPLRPAVDAIVLDTTSMSAPDVADQILELARQRCSRAAARGNKPG